ncbi:MAG: hypothetical protein AAGB93_18555 [Planctomycetota bacterium]
MWTEYDGLVGGEDAEPSSVLAQARERDAEVLVLLGASFCPRTAALRARLEAARGALGDRYVCVDVDKDRHPEVDARLRGAGWPTLAVLDATGALVREVLEHGEGVVADLLGEPPTTAASDRRADSDRYAAIVDEITDVLVASADPVWGGWGARQKFPHPDALHFLLVRWSATGRDDLLATVLRTLRSMQGREIHDALEGGFYRFATRSDWSVPNFEKPLLSNAKRLLAYAEAHQALGEDSFRATAEGVARWMQGALVDDATGAFRGSQDADPTYARLSTLEARERHGEPAVDPTIHADRNAWAAIGLLKAGFVFDDDALTRRALDVLDFLTTKLFDPERGVSHYWNGTWNQPGDLRDQGAVLRSLVEAVHYAGANRFLAPAEAIARWTVDTLGADDGSFRRDPFTDDVAPALRTADDLRWNAVAAEALVRLGLLTRDRAWIDRGRAALAPFADVFRPHGFATASFARALDLVVREPVHVVIVGGAEDDRTRSLARAALRPYVASRIVQRVDPATEPDLLARLGLDVTLPEVPFAIVEQGARTYAATGDPVRLPALMARSERG